MEFIQDYITLLPRFLPSSIVSPIISTVSTLFGIFKAASTHLSPLLTRIVTQPDVASILALIAILFLSLKVLDMAYRAVMFWVKLVLRLAVWGTAVAVALWVYSRGMDGFVEDVQHLAEYWTVEYRKFEGEVRGWKEKEEAQIRFNAWQQGGRSNGGWTGWRQRPGKETKTRWLA